MYAPPSVTSLADVTTALWGHEFNATLRLKDERTVKVNHVLLLEQFTKSMDGAKRGFAKVCNFCVIVKKAEPVRYNWMVL